MHRNLLKFQLLYVYIYIYIYIYIYNIKLYFLCIYALYTIYIEKYVIFMCFAITYLKKLASKITPKFSI